MAKGKEAMSYSFKLFRDLQSFKDELSFLSSPEQLKAKLRFKARDRDFMPEGDILGYIEDVSKDLLKAYEKAVSGELWLDNAAVKVSTDYACEGYLVKTDEDVVYISKNTMIAYTGGKKLAKIYSDYKRYMLDYYHCDLTDPEFVLDTFYEKYSLPFRSQAHRSHLKDEYKNLDESATFVSFQECPILAGLLAIISSRRIRYYSSAEDIVGYTTLKMDKLLVVRLINKVISDNRHKEFIDKNTNDVIVCVSDIVSMLQLPYRVKQIEQFLDRFTEEDRDIYEGVIQGTRLGHAAQTGKMVPYTSIPYYVDDMVY